MPIRNIHSIRRIAVLVVVLLGGSATLGFAARHSPIAAPTDYEIGIRKTLDAQVTAWNQGDIPGFMEGYVKSDALRFASGNNAYRGWQATLDRYQKSYDTTSKMGILKFSDFEFQKLSDDAVEVFGRFHLTRDEANGNATGLFTLLMIKTDGKWLVLHDHTSVDPKPLTEQSTNP